MDGRSTVTGAWRGALLDRDAAEGCESPVAARR
jgi:hypothetical protein